jgi:hypothetical protein
MKKNCILPRAFLFLLGTLGALMANAQSDSTKLFPWKLHLQSRFSLAEGSLVGIWGVSGGYVWGPYEREITLGYQWLGSRGSRQLGKIEEQIAVKQGLDTYYIAKAGFANVGYWHIVHNSRRWKFGFPIELGLGKATARPQSVSEDSRFSPTLTSSILPLQVGGYGEWKATRWVGIGLQAGYRQNLIRFAPVDNLNGPYGRVRVLVYPATYVEWLRFIFKKKPLPSPFYKKGKTAP